jgi:multidrug efflux pump subunit AcrA (membrane-fusion protein)
MRAILKANSFSLFIGFVSLLFSCESSSEYIKPVIVPLIESVYSSVTVEPDSLYAVYSSVRGILYKNSVSEGDLVQEGDELFEIVNSSPKLNTENARLTFELAKFKSIGKTAILSELKREVDNAYLKYEDDSIDYYRQKRLWEKDIGSKNDCNKRKLTFELSLNNLNILKNKFERTTYELETQLRQAENNYKNSAIINKNYTVKSKIHGKVYEVLKNPGELISGQEPIAYVGSKNSFVIKMFVDEVDIAKIKEGQKVLVVLDAYGKQLFNAKVNKIYPRMDARSQTFLVEGLFINQPETFYSSLTGEANIIISEKKAVLTIPLDYLINNQKVLTKGGFIEVKTGVRNLERVEIVSGIDTNSVLVKPE